MKKKLTSSVPTSFLQKIFDMLSNESISSVVAWDSDGTEFIIFNMNEFAEKVLPIYFKHSNFASFIRQLNMYDFHKVRSNSQEHIYKHPLFLRGRQDLLKEIHRKTAENNWPVVQKQSITKGDLSPVLTKLMHLHKKNITYESQISSLEEKVSKLTSQNKVLADELWENKDLLNKIENALMFFARLFKQNSGNEESFNGFSQIGDFLSITEIPEDHLLKRQKVEDLSLASPLNISGFSEDFIVEPNDLEDKIDGFSLIDNHSEVSFDDKLDLLFES